jgi:HEAT repeat protein
MSLRVLAPRFCFAAAIIMHTAVCGAARADVFELKNGGRMEGRAVAKPDDDQSKYVIELAAGGRVMVPRSQVSRVDTVSGDEAEYRKLARTSPDTVDAHWKIVEWCRERKLVAHMKPHLARILELDPNHEQARTLSGFREENGEWMTRDEVMESRGMVLYEGRYVTPQHVELLQRQKQDKVVQGDWGNTIDRLRRVLMGRRKERIPAARAEIAAIRDPAAAEAVVNVLKREQDAALKRMWMEVASRIEHKLTVDALVHLSLADPDPEVRYQSLDYLVRSRRPGVAAPYIRALKNRDNEIVNRAGAALGQIGNRDAIGPLIDALITMHKIKLAEGNPDQHAYSFTPDSGAFSFGGSGPKVVPQTIQNPAVLAALVSLSGGTSFDYDQEQWRRWLAAQAKHNAIDVRRDE